MYQKNDSALPLVSGFQPMGAFLETRGNQTGNKIVSALKAFSYQWKRDALMPWKRNRPVFTRFVSSPVKISQPLTLSSWATRTAGIRFSKSSNHETYPARQAN
jgi:hypothetical protein